MKKTTKPLRFLYIFPLAIAGALTFLAGLGVLKRPDLAACDALYQQPVGTDGKIVIIGIDQQALEAYGPYQEWCREGIARTLDILNADPGSRPAAIGIDVLFGGETASGADQALAEAARRGGNVITACAAGFETGFAETDSGFVHRNLLMTAFEEPYPALKDATKQGHINAMLDKDGILRHHLLYFDLPDKTRIPSLALALAAQYQENLGLLPVNSYGFWYLPYSKTPGDFEIRSIAKVLEGEDPASYFRDKIVLIGPCAAGLQDSYFTSIDHARQMYGVEYQANAIQAILDGNYKREAGDGIQLAALFLLLLAAFAAFWRRRVRTSTVLWLALCAGWVLLCKGLYETGWVLHVLWVPAGVTVLYAGCLAANYIQAALERQRVTRTFQRYVAPEIVSELMGADPAAMKLGGKKCDVAVLFVDIRGFTAMSEELGPEQVVAILNQYLTLTTKCVMDFHGTLDKFVGDCTMAFWNAPLPQEDYVMLACRAAMAMAEGAKPLAEQLMAKHKHTVSFGIGVHTGPAVIGNIGAPMRMDYTAIGDTVNTAARLESHAPAGTIYISRAVADALAGRIAATPLKDPPQLKGKSAGFEILTLDAIL
ncbi:adenylate/guanylate cyclase domain-containing protein [Clostridiaceae bacterium]|nr:adenylate/guanylate cyclase domain-containing protein [Clostridiaceae bacterium]RKI12442.1 adenylate/guanylate cyclase domain-containing protein [bacterium 1XD21-70]